MDTPRNFSSLPRPGASRLPAPGASRLPAPPSMSAPPPRDQLAEVSVAHVNSKLNRQDKIVETENMKPSGVSRLQMAGSKRPAPPPEANEQRHSQVARSAITQSANTKLKSSKSSANLKASLTAPRGLPAAKAQGLNASMNSRPGALLAQAATATEVVAPVATAPLKKPARKEWDVKGRLQDLEEDHRALMEKTRTVETENDESGMRVIELETMRRTLETKNYDLQTNLDHHRSEHDRYKRLYEEEERRRRNEQDDAARQLRNETDELRRKGLNDVEDLMRRHTLEIADVKAKAADEVDKNRKLVEQAEKGLRDEKVRSLAEIATIRDDAAREISSVRSTTSQELADIKARFEAEKLRLETELESRARTIKNLKDDLESMEKQHRDLKSKLQEQSTESISLESSARALRDKIMNLEADVRYRNDTIDSKVRDVSALEAKVEEINEKLRNEEMLRRKLHNEVLELKGNIRVFCRVRPTLAEEAEPVIFEFPDKEKDGKDIQLHSTERTLMGTETNKKHAFSYDKVFGPQSNNNEIFEEISQLVQSALDGYNVCIFCYGQTGSGKTYTMSSSDGMIPQAVTQIYNTAKALEDKGWSYTMEGSFVEVYNENINDLLGKAKDLDCKKLEVRHDKGKTDIVGCTSVVLDGPQRMEEILERASKNRSVAATKANERSSRSHSVFILRLIGVNNITGEKSDGTLNLVDLAGSERLSHSQATGDRLKETQNINKSLSSLGDVISALANGKDGAHIPYRNSKLTYLLQHSLGGNSKTLMFVMVSPLQAHMNETITSLKFATKVINTHIGTAKKIKTEKE